MAFEDEKLAGELVQLGFALVPVLLSFGFDNFGARLGVALLRFVELALTSFSVKHRLSPRCSG